MPADQPLKAQLNLFNGDARRMGYVMICLLAGSISTTTPRRSRCRKSSRRWKSAMTGLLWKSVEWAIPAVNWPDRSLSVRGLRSRGSWGAADDCIVFTSGATEANNLAILSCLPARLVSKRRVVTTTVEHSSILKLCDQFEERGARSRAGPQWNRNGLVDLRQLEYSLTASRWSCCRCNGSTMRRA